MTKKIVSLFLLLFYIHTALFAGNEKPDNSPLGKIKRDIETLTHSKMDGRLTGTDGEMLAADYIESRFTELGLSPFMGSYKQEFKFEGGPKIGKSAFFKLFDKNLLIGTEVIWLPFGKGNTISGFAYPQVFEPNNVWLVSLKKLATFEFHNPQKSIYEFAKYAESQNANSVVFINDIEPSQDLSSTNLAKFDLLNIPVAYINHKAYLNFIKPNLTKDWLVVDAKLGFDDTPSTGKNVMAYLNNKSALTIVIASHYDGVGNGFECANSNASGVACMLALAEQLKNNKSSLYNYLFVAFSGTEENLIGSNSFLTNFKSLKTSFASMINIDAVGRMNKQKEIYVAGLQTAGVFLPIIQKNGVGYKLQIDSSGYGYSDYRNFYLQQIPVLNFSTGYGNDYLTEQDKSTSITANVILEMSNLIAKNVIDISKVTKPVFTKTYDILPELQKLKVDLGILFDFSFNENGLKVAACKPNKLAAKAGIQTGDVITKMGEFTIVDFDDYIEAIKKTNKDREITVVVKRDGTDFKFFMTLKE